MHPHLAKIATKAWLEESARRFRQRLAAAFQRIDICLCLWCNFRTLTSISLCLQFLIFFILTQQSTQPFHAFRTFSLYSSIFNRGNIRHPHHLFSHPVSFLLVDIARLPNLKFSLKSS